MVFFLQGGAMRLMMSDLPEDARERLRRIRYCVFGLWFFGFMRTLGDFSGAMNDLLLAIMGTFLLSQDEDPTIQRCHECLNRGICGICCTPGGMRLLMPFLLIAMINATFDGVLLVSVLFNNGLIVLLFPLVWYWVGCFVCETLAAYHCWHVIQAITSILNQFEGDYAGLSGDAGAPNQQRQQRNVPGLGGLRPQRGLSPPQPQRMGPHGPQGPQFVPFAGQGHRLTDDV